MYYTVPRCCTQGRIPHRVMGWSNMPRIVICTPTSSMQQGVACHSCPNCRSHCSKKSSVKKLDFSQIQSRLTTYYRPKNIRYKYQLRYNLCLYLQCILFLLELIPRTCSCRTRLHSTADFSMLVCTAVSLITMIKHVDICE